MSDKQKKQVPKLGTCMNTGDPGGIRTPDPRLRRPLLYPTGLLDHVGFERHRRFVTVPLTVPFRGERTFAHVEWTSSEC